MPISPNLESQFKGDQIIQILVFEYLIYLIDLYSSFPLISQDAPDGILPFSRKCKLVILKEICKNIINNIDTQGRCFSSIHNHYNKSFPKSLKRWAPFGRKFQDNWFEICKLCTILVSLVQTQHVEEKAA